MFSQFFSILGQLLFFIGIAPLISGIVSFLKNRARMRQGQSVFQPYYNIIKLFSKEEVVSQSASWIFSFAPTVVMASALAACLLVPVFVFQAPAAIMADFLALIFIFSLGRFFLALAALDTGSSFGGMGSSREMFISSLVEPALCLVVFSVALPVSSTNLQVLSASHNSVSSIVAGAALFFLMLAETSRIPVDNQETHLELTMVHEAMVLEYSGRKLALIELASHIKQMVWFLLVAQIIFPSAAPDISSPKALAFSAAWFAEKVFLVAAAVALVEVSMAKMRLFRVADFLGFAFVLGMIALFCSIMGT